MKINIGKSFRSAHSTTKVYRIEGFEVWREGKKWHALKWPRVLEASTKKDIVKMISESTPHQN